jgi:hypothetical protein
MNSCTQRSVNTLLPDWSRKNSVTAGVRQPAGCRAGFAP